ncbi:hypothetical protein MTO96_013376 [Rhipicephalus appendiculatus]
MARSGKKTQLSSGPRPIAVLHLLHVVRFPNLMCTGSWGQEGTCYAFQECMERGGTAYGPCAFGFGVCCSPVRVSTLPPGAAQTPPSGDDGAGGQSSCAVQVFKLSDRICQLRLDFDEFDLERPTVGNCDGEKLIRDGTECQQHGAASVRSQHWPAPSVDESV